VVTGAVGIDEDPCRPVGPRARDTVVRRLPGACGVDPAGRPWRGKVRESCRWFGGHGACPVHAQAHRQGGRARRGPRDARSVRRRGLPGPCVGDRHPVPGVPVPGPRIRHGSAGPRHPSRPGRGELSGTVRPTRRSGTEERPAACPRDSRSRHRDSRSGGRDSGHRRRPGRCPVPPGRRAPGTGDPRGPHGPRHRARLRSRHLTADGTGPGGTVAVGGRCAVGDRSPARPDLRASRPVVHLPPPVPRRALAVAVVGLRRGPRCRGRHRVAGP